MLRNLLMFRLVIMNVCAVAALMWAYAAGFLQYINYDASRISYFIVALMLIALVSIFNRAMKVTRALNAIKAGVPVRINAAKFIAKGNHIDWLSTACVGFGFFGTIVGIIAMLFAGEGITSDGSVESITAIIEKILAGGGTAFITTGVGLATSQWIDFNALILSTATTCMIEDGRRA